MNTPSGLGPLVDISLVYSKLKHVLTGESDTTDPEALGPYIKELQD